MAKNILNSIRNPTQDQIDSITNKIIEARKKEKLIQFNELLKERIYQI